MIPLSLKEDNIPSIWRYKNGKDLYQIKKKYMLHENLQQQKIDSTCN